MSRNDRDPNYFELPLERSGSTWRFWVAGVLSAMLLVGLLRGERATDHVNEWPAFASVVLLLPAIISLTVSGVGIQRGWSPHALFRFLPLLVLLALFLFGIALGGC